MKKTFGIIGRGGHAREVASYTEKSPLFFAIDDDYRDMSDPMQLSLNDTPKKYLEVGVVVAIGSPLIRQLLVGKWAGDLFTTVIASNAHVDGSVVVGAGAMVAPGAVIMCGAELGEHSIVNVAASINHDCAVGDFATISPGARLGGNVTIGSGAFIGMGALVRNGLNIADGAVIGMGACLVSDATEENGVYIGIPARLMRVNDGWLRNV